MFTLKQVKTTAKRIIDFIILKNRQGRAYEEIALTYLPKHNYFR